MSKRKTPGERFRAKADPLFSPHVKNYDDFERLMDWLEEFHNAAIRRARAEAWDECCEWSSAPDNKAANPYRKGGKR